MKNVLFILIATLVVVGCKKDKETEKSPETKIENNLWDKGGEWNITLLEQKATYSHSNENNFSETYYNIGTMQFNKDGSGMTTTKFENEETQKSNFTYKNTNNTLTIYSVDGDVSTYDLVWKENAFTISNKETETYTDYDENNNPFTETVTYEVTITCNKK